MSEPHQVSEPTSANELISVVLATGRLGGADAAADIWCTYVQAWRWDETAARMYCRLLRLSAEGTIEDERIAEYVCEMTTLIIKLAAHKVHLASPREVNEWFRAATYKYKQPQPQPQASAPPKAKPTTTKDEFYRQLIAGDKPKGKKR